MFLHVQTLDKQYSVHLDDDKPLSLAVTTAASYWMHNLDNCEVKKGDKVLDVDKTAGENSLHENDTITVTKKS